MFCRVKRGSRGIALLPENDDSRRVRYVFDVSDLIPDIEMDPEPEEKLTRYGRARRKFLKEEHEGVCRML